MGTLSRNAWGEANGRAFEEAVLRAVRAIPAGEAATHGELAAAAGRPGAARAVGNLLARLPAGTEVPAHRVVRADRRLACRHRSRQVRRLRAAGVRLARRSAG